jgi:hypothetical protein
MLLNKISVRWGHRMLSPCATTFIILATRPSKVKHFKAHQKPQSSPIKKDLFILAQDV